MMELARNSNNEYENYQDLEEDSSASSQIIPLLRRSFRGRVLLTITLVIVLSLVFSIIGYQAKKPVYVSSGIIRISASKPTVLNGEQYDARLRMFDAFVRAEVTYIKSRPVLERALQSEELITRFMGNEAESLMNIQQSLTVKREGGIITLSSSRNNPEESAAIVNAILEAYDDLNKEQNRQRDSIRQNGLLERKTKILDNLKTTNHRILEVGQEYGLQALAKAHVQKIAQIEEMEQRIYELQTTIEQKESLANPELNTVDKEIKRLTVLDHAMADMLFQRSQQAAELSTLRDRYQLNHSKVKNAEKRLSVLDDSIESRRQQLAILGQTGSLANTQKKNEETLRELKLLNTKLSDRLKNLRNEAKELNSKLIELNFLEEEKKELRDYLDETRRILEQVTVESKNNLPGTVEIQSLGSVPILPASDKRNALALLGLLGGSGLGIIIMIGYAFLFPRFRFSDDVEMLNEFGSLVGTYPAIEIEDSESLTEISSQMIRNHIMLQNKRSKNEGQVIAISSQQDTFDQPILVKSLARAFSQSKLRTILVDADLMTKQITHHFNVEHEEGFRESINNQKLNGEVQHLTDEQFSILPSGKTSDIRDDNLSYDLYSGCIEKLRKNYDIILLFTGAFPNRLATTVQLSICDRIVFFIHENAIAGSTIKTVKRIHKNVQKETYFLFHGANENDPSLLDIKNFHK
jgi:uncharacterized protein involved in exopolysaccharide biosynthesis